MAFVTDSNRPQPLWQPPPTACLTAPRTASEVPSLLMHPWASPSLAEMGHIGAIWVTGMPAQATQVTPPRLSGPRVVPLGQDLRATSPPTWGPRDGRHRWGSNFSGGPSANQNFSVAHPAPLNAPHHLGGGVGGWKKAATRRNMRREEWVTVQGPVKKQQPDGMSHGGGGGGPTHPPTPGPAPPPLKGALDRGYAAHLISAPICEPTDPGAGPG